ncbi:uncharacterized protein LOC126808849 isoform X2 [Patella vulgata]|uniref:uncharacterized protein LOC126808849 isoform X2 n=1 Tax=Patella vulgata TaxID=6465 RepID=UPI00217FE24A|nr:uncharacterized protein LOC126808849 isoform X2 [Patella vulgata]
MAEGGMSSDIDFQDVRRPPDREVPTRGVLPEEYKIQTHFPILVNELACRPDAIIDSLYSKNVIDNDDVQKITKEAKNGSRAMAKAILRTLLGCGPGAYNKFISCLHDNNFTQALLRLEPTAGSFLDEPKQQYNDVRWLCQQTLANGLDVSVVYGDLLAVHADVLVCSNYGTGSMEGKIAKKIRARAGPDYCLSLRELYKKKSSLKDWGVYQTFAGDLKFKCVYQVKIPSCPSGGMQSWLSNLEDLYSKILTRADKEKHVTVTLPLIGSDFARGPADQCVEAAIDALQNHNVKNLSGVNIVSDDVELLSKLRQDLKSLRYSTDSTPCGGQSKIDTIVEICTYLGRKVPDLIDMPGIKGTMNEKMGVEFFNTDTEQNGEEVEDELTTSSEDADGALYKQNLPNGMVITLYDDDIVNISSDILVCYKYNTTKYQGRIDKHLKQVGGRDYIQSLKSLEEGDLESWKVYFTLAGNLQFHLVYQAVIPELDEENTEEWLSNLQILYSTILTTADDEKRDSITFPITGIGPVDQCIEAFITTLKHHEAKTIRTIKIVANKEAIIKKLCKGLTKAVGTAPTAVARRIPKETQQKTASISEDPFDFVSSVVSQFVNTDVVKGIYNEIFGIPVFKRGKGGPNGQKRYKPAIKEKSTENVVTKRKNTLKSYNRRIPNGLVVFVYNEDVVDVHADILVVCNDKKGSSKRGLAKYLKAKGGRQYTDSLETLMEMEGELEDWKLYFTLPGNLKFKEIYQVTFPQKTDGGGAAAVALPAVDDDYSDDDDDDDDEDDDEYEDDGGGSAAAPVATGAASVADDAADGAAVENRGSDAGDAGAGCGGGGGDRLQQLYSQILSTADTDKHESITIPLLGSGVSGGQTVQCIEAAIGAIQTHPVTNLRHINIVTKDDGRYDLLRDKLKTLPTDNDS